MTDIEARMNAVGDLIDDMPSTSNADSLPYNVSWLLAVLEVVDDTVTLTALASGARKLQRIVSGVLADPSEHRWEAECPSCGERSLSANPHAADPYVCCVNINCAGDRPSFANPNVPMCGNYDWNGRPLWPSAEFEFLASEMDRAAAARVAAAALTEDVA